MEERKCGYKIVAYVDGVRKEFECDPNKGCLRELVWTKGVGVNRAAAKVLGLKDEKIQAYVEGSCRERN
jgi:hypothetical protein